MRARHAAPDAAGSGSRLVAAGAVLFGVGVLAVGIAVVPVLLGADAAPDLAATASGVLLPLGLAIALGGLLRGARARRRAARRRSADRSSTRT